MVRRTHGFLRASGYFAIRPYLERYPHIRILVGINVDAIMADYHRRGLLFLADPVKALEKCKLELRKDIQNAAYSREVEAGVLRFVDDVITNKISLRAHPTRRLHAKLYIFRPKGFNEHRPGAVITGSSNLTAAGLGANEEASNYEFNVLLHDFDEVKFATEEFDRLWTESVPILPKAIEEARDSTYLGDQVTPQELALALREFFTLERPFPRPIEGYANVFADSTTSQPLVKLTFRDALGNREISWQKALAHPLEVSSGAASTTTAEREMLMGISRCSGFFDYRALLRASLSSQPVSLAEQLFLLFADSLLSGFRVRVGGSESSVGELWLKLKDTAPQTRHEWHMSSANSVAKRFDSAFRPFLDQLTAKTNEYLATFPNCKIKVRFEYPGSSFSKATKLLTGKAVNPTVEFNGRAVGGHNEFLNEARLTALALSMFLAAVKLADSDPSNPDPLRLLVLDDVLIGLDLNNRFPLLELLRTQFPQHQILLLTHDLRLVRNCEGAYQRLGRVELCATV